MITTAIFDLGGVYFSNGMHIAFHKITDKFGLQGDDVLQALDPSSPLSREYRRGDIDGPRFWNTVKKRLKFDASTVELTEIWNESYEPVEETVKIVRRLKQNGVKLYFLSDTVADRAAHLESKYNFRENFINGIYSFQIHVTKWDGNTSFLKAIEQSGAAPENIVFVDDKLKYVEKARKLGMKGIHFTRPAALERELKELGLL